MLGLLAVMLLRWLLPDQHAATTAVSYASVSTVAHPQMMKYGAFYLLMMNLCFGSLGLLMTKACIEYQLITYGSLNLLSFFYSGFIIFNLGLLFYDKKINRLLDLKHLVGATYILCLGIASMAYLFEKTMILYLCAVFGGLLYGFTLGTFSAVTLRWVEGDGAAQSFAYIESVGRVGLLLSFLGVGFLIGQAVSIQTLWVMMAVLCWFSLTVLVIHALKSSMTIWIEKN